MGGLIPHLLPSTRHISRLWSLLNKLVGRIPVKRTILIVGLSILLLGAMCRQSQSSAGEWALTQGDIADYENNTGAVTGQIVDSETNEPLVGVSVQLKETTVGTLTDIRGRFRIVRIAPGAHTLVLACIGYKKAEISVDVQSNKSTEIKPLLTSQALDTRAQTIRCMNSWIVEGTVREQATNVPIQGAKVRVNPGNFKTKTNKLGYFQFSFRGGGISDLTVSHKLYQTTKLDVTMVKGDSTISVNVSLIPK